MGNMIIKLALDFLTTSNWLEQSIFIKPQGRTMKGFLKHTSTRRKQTTMKKCPHALFYSLWKTSTRKCM